MNKQTITTSLRRGRESIMRFSTIYYLKYQFSTIKLYNMQIKKNVYLIHRFTKGNRNYL